MDYFNLKDKIISVLNYFKANGRMKAMRWTKNHQYETFQQKAIDQFHLGNNYKENITNGI